jgi:signal transduction histidine kinase
VARYAPGAPTAVTLRYGALKASLCVTNGAASGAPGRSEQSSAGGGHGLATMRERIERAGGTMHAGATADGWRVELEVPA